MSHRNPYRTALQYLVELDEGTLVLDLAIQYSTTVSIHMYVIYITFQLQILQQPTSSRNDTQRTLCPDHRASAVTLQY